MKILDYYCHQGHQYEFFKTGHDFYLTGLDSLPPNWNKDSRPLPPNVTLIGERAAHSLKFDVVMVRSPLNPKRYSRFVDKGAIPVAVCQTTNPYHVLPSVKHIVWNSKEVMEKSKGFYDSKINHTFIIHGFDPKEFKPLGIEKNKRVLSVINVFIARKEYVGYDLWNSVNKKIGNICDVVGHGNEDLPQSIGEANNFEELIKYYNLYPVYFNPTNDSANPRARAEAMMSGCPIVTTNNYGISDYIKNGSNGFLSNNHDEIIKYLKILINNEDLQKEMSENARNTAIQYFNIEDYVKRWNSLLWNL